MLLRRSDDQIQIPAQAAGRGALRNASSAALLHLPQLRRGSGRQRPRKKAGERPCASLKRESSPCRSEGAGGPGCSEIRPPRVSRVKHALDCQADGTTGPSAATCNSYKTGAEPSLVVSASTSAWRANCTITARSSSGRDRHVRVSSQA